MVSRVCFFDAQGNEIAVSDERRVEITLHGESDQGDVPICFQEDCQVEMRIVLF